MAAKTKKIQIPAELYEQHEKVYSENRRVCEALGIRNVDHLVQTVMFVHYLDLKEALKGE